MNDLGFTRASKGAGIVSDLQAGTPPPDVGDGRVGTLPGGKDAEASRQSRGASLSTKLLLLTILFVMVAEVLIFVPSIANFRRTWLMERLAAAQIASLAAEAAPDGQLPKMLRDELLNSAQVKGIALKRNEERVLIISADMTDPIDAHYDLRSASPFALVGDALGLLVSPAGRTIRVVGQPGFGAGEFIEIIMPEDPLRTAVMGFGLNILGLSIVISLVTAALVFLALNWLLVRPMRRITGNMERFRQNPEDISRIITTSGRRDEVGRAEVELAAMQTDLAGLLQQKSRLAALGLAVSKINHDLRNILSTAHLMSDRLAAIPDPTVERLTPRLIGSLDRAIRLCGDTLRYGRAHEAAPSRAVFSLRSLVVEVGHDLALPRHGEVDWIINVDDTVSIDADHDQLYRVLANICRNAIQVLGSDDITRSSSSEASAGTQALSHTSFGNSDNEAQGAAKPSGNPAPGYIEVRGHRDAGATVILIGDNGPGVPDKARAHLFQAFQSSQRKGGTGLGLAIAAELVRAHGGTIDLIDPPRNSGPGAAGKAGPGASGAWFRIEIPDRQADAA